MIPTAVIQNQRARYAVGAFILLFLGILLAPQLKGLTDSVNEQLVVAKKGAGFVVKQIDVIGALHTDDAALNEVLADMQGRGIDHVDLERVKAHIEAISWVQHADVERHLPDRIVVKIKERTPFALWQYAGVLSLVDAQGNVLTRDDLARWRDLPFLVGKAAPEAAPDLLNVINADADISDMVDALIYVGERRFDVKLTNNIVVRLPARVDGAAYGPQDAWSRLIALEHQDSILSRDIAIIDLRLEDRIAVRLTPNGRALGLAEGQSI